MGRGWRVRKWGGGGDGEVGGGWRRGGGEGGTVMNISDDTEIWPHYWQYKMNDFSLDEGEGGANRTIR